MPLQAEVLLFSTDTSGAVGNPNGCQHGTGGNLAYVAGTTKYVRDSPNPRTRPPIPSKLIDAIYARFFIFIFDAV
jgi:acyl-coenzyme A synthetase/AMP-(fatty) acid ligase